MNAREVGERIAGRYEVVSVVGRRPLGMLYRAIDLEIGVDVALRMIQPALLPDEATRQAFVQKLGRGRAMQHPNLVRLYGVSVQGDEVAVAVQWAPGAQLSERITAGPLQPTEVRKILRQVASAMVHAHQHGVVLGDVRLDSIVVLEEALKLSNVGIGPALPRKQYLEAVRGERGSHHFLAPEIRNGLAAEPRADVYSLAALAVELMSGAPPAKPLIVPGATTPLLQLLKRALAEEPLERHASAEALGAELDALLAAAAGEQTVPSAPVRRPMPAPPTEAGNRPGAASTDASRLASPGSPRSLALDSGEIATSQMGRYMAPTVPGLPTSPELPAVDELYAFDEPTRQVDADEMRRIQGAEVTRRVPEEEILSLRMRSTGTQRTSIEEVGRDGAAPYEELELEVRRDPEGTVRTAVPAAKSGPTPTAVPVAKSGPTPTAVPAAKSGPTPTVAARPGPPPARPTPPPLKPPSPPPLVKPGVAAPVAMAPGIARPSDEQHTEPIVLLDSDAMKTTQMPRYEPDASGAAVAGHGPPPAPARLNAGGDATVASPRPPARPADLGSDELVEEQTNRVDRLTAEELRPDGAKDRASHARWGEARAAAPREATGERREGPPARDPTPKGGNAPPPQARELVVPDRPASVQAPLAEQPKIEITELPFSTAPTRADRKLPLRPPAPPPAPPALPAPGPARASTPPAATTMSIEPVSRRPSRLGVTVMVLAFFGALAAIGIGVLHYVNELKREQDRAEKQRLADELNARAEAMKRGEVPPPPKPPQPAPPAPQAGERPDGVHASTLGPQGPCPLGSNLVSGKVPFCVDVYEYPGGKTIPRTAVSFEEAGRLCSARGERLCTDVEWERACRGKGGASFPYGSAYDGGRCNTDGSEIRPSGSFRDCRSGAGAYDMSGNVAEWVSAHGQPAQKGGSARDGQSIARCSHTARGPAEGGVFVGFRCCSDATASR